MLTSCRTEQDDYLYAIFDGYDGVYAPGFAHQGLPAELLLGQLSSVHDDAEVKRILLRAFVTVERGLFESLDHVVAERANLKLSLPDVSFSAIFTSLFILKWCPGKACVNIH